MPAKVPRATSNQATKDPKDPLCGIASGRAGVVSLCPIYCILLSTIEIVGCLVVQRETEPKTRLKVRNQAYNQDATERAGWLQRTARLQCGFKCLESLDRSQRTDQRTNVGRCSHVPVH